MGNYKLIVFDHDGSWITELWFEDVAIHWNATTVSVTDREGKLLYMVSINHVTVEVVEESMLPQWEEEDD